MFCQVSVALGKDPNTLGKIFVEYHTWQRPHDKFLVSKGGAIWVLKFFLALGKAFEDRHEKKPEKNALQNCTFFLTSVPKLCP